MYAFRHHHVTTVYVCGEESEAVRRQTGGDEVIFLGQPTAAMRGIKFRTLFLIARLFRRNSFDVVIAHRYKPIYFAGVMSYFFRIPVLLAVVHEHDVFRRPTRRLFITFWCRNIVCVGVSATVSANIEKYCGNLTQAGRLYTLPHAIDSNWRNNLLPRDQVRQDFGIKPGTFLVGTIGRLIDKKEQHVLIDAFAHFQVDKDASLIVIGDGPNESRLRARVADLGIESRVTFAGRVDDAYRLLRALDVFVLPSGTMEAFGMVLLEAMLAGIPVVASDAPGPAEVVGDSGLLFESGDAPSLTARLVEIHAMAPASRARLIARAQERLDEQYTLAAFEQRIWAIGPLLEAGASGGL